MALPRHARAWITGLGLTTSIGGNTKQSCTSLRAGLLRFEPTERYLCTGWDAENGDLEPATIAPALDLEAEGAERLLTLCLPALGEAVSSAGLTRRDMTGASLHLALAGGSAPAPEGVTGVLSADLPRRAALPKPALVTASRAGHSGFAEALRAALESLSAGGSRAIVACVDSLIERPALAWLDRYDRLKCSRAPEGVIAGEAAAVLIVETPRAAERRGRVPRATIDALGFGVEAATVFAEAACIGRGLCDAVREAVTTLGKPPEPAWVVNDQNGERYRALEWSYVLARLHATFGQLRHQWYVADCVGETGAAVGGLAAARVISAFDRGHAPSSRAWIPLSSDDGGRAAVVLGAPDVEG